MEHISSSLSVAQYRARYPKVIEKPFSSSLKYQYSIHRDLDNEENGMFLVLKGAPERVIHLCTKTIDENGNTVELSTEDLLYFEQCYRELGSMGERVIAFADLELEETLNELEDLDKFELRDLRYLGLISMIDPPKPSVPQAISRCREAGILVIMVTGDHPITAQSIAQSVGIFTHPTHRRSTQISLPRIDPHPTHHSIVIPGDELSTLSHTDLCSILHDFKEIVFARNTPQQKLRIVEACQDLGRIVAVTGDGVNDSPALKKADIGIAMGITGSEVSKQAADMILIDDNFASIVVGVEQGRAIFDNMAKTIGYILAGNSCQLYPFFIYVIFGYPISLSPIQMLCIALGTDLFPAISLAYETPERDIMRLSPRDPKRDRLITKNLLLWAYLQGGVIVTAAGYLGYFVTLMQFGWMPWQLWQIRDHWDREKMLSDYYEQHWTIEDRALVTQYAQSAYFTSVVVTQWAGVMVAKTRRTSIFLHGFRNWCLNGALILETIIACILLYVPGLNHQLTFAPVSWWAWLTGLPFFLYYVMYEEMRKCVVRKWPSSFLAGELYK